MTISLSHLSPQILNTFCPFFILSWQVCLCHWENRNNQKRTFIHSHYSCHLASIYTPIVCLHSYIVDKLSIVQFKTSLLYFLVAQMVKHLATVWETWVRSLGQEDPLEKEMATHSSVHAWKIPWAEEPGGPMELQRVGHDWATSLHLLMH